MTTAPLRPANTVVLLHGLGLGGWAMARLAGSLRGGGFRTVNLTYPSRTMPLEQLATQWLPAQLRARGVAAVPLVHFVTHSMGGIVLPHSHTWLQWRADTARAVGRFLQHGSFGPPAPPFDARSSGSL
jgi:hypothetical protein